MDDTLYVSSKNPLGHSWGCGDRLLVYTRPQSHESIPDSEACIHEVRWGASMTSNEFMRRLAKTSYGKDSFFFFPSVLQLLAFQMFFIMSKITQIQRNSSPSVYSTEPP